MNAIQLRLVKYAQDVLAGAGIDLNDAVNGFFTDDSTHGGTHTIDYLRDLADALRQTGGNKNKIIQVLKSIALNGGA